MTPYSSSRGIRYTAPPGPSGKRIDWTIDADETATDAPDVVPHETGFEDETPGSSTNGAANRGTGSAVGAAADD